MDNPSRKSHRIQETMIRQLTLDHFEKIGSEDMEDQTTIEQWTEWEPYSIEDGTRRMEDN